MEALAEAVVVVTGGASGIGLAMARHFARAGARLVLADVESTALGSAVRSLPEGTLGVTTDVTSAEEVEQLAQTVLSHFGRVDVVCNNAGVSTFNLLEHQTLDDWRWVIDVNLWGVVHGVQTFVPIMRAQGTPGHVVNTASSAALVGAVPFMAPYAVSKAGVVTLSETLRAELELAGVPIGVSVLCPGFTNTNVLDGERNRPARFGRERRTQESETVVRFIKDSFASEMGREPDDVAALVLDAVLENRFWIISQGGMRPTFATRHQGVESAAPDE